MPLSGGDEIKLLDDPPPGYWAYFSIGPGGAYVLNLQGTDAAVEFHDFSRNNATRVYKLTHAPALYSTLTASGDGRWILFTAVTRQRDLFLVENFH
jgi:hypothetical protein